ncbi:MAG: SgcJ/EcaC family oxidoreductase [Ginsengibacter sp.]
MKLLFLLACCFIIGAQAFAQSSSDENAVRAVFQKMSDAWKAHDYGYTHDDILDENAVFINPVGVYFKSKAAITKVMQYVGVVRFKYEKPLQDSILSIRFLSPSSALVVHHSVAEIIQDFTMPGETNITKKGERDDNFQTYTLVNQNGTWRITSITATEVVKGLR